MADYHLSDCIRGLGQIGYKNLGEFKPNGIKLRILLVT